MQTVLLRFSPSPPNRLLGRAIPQAVPAIHMSLVATLPPGLVADNKGPGIIAATCAATVLATLFCAARIYANGHVLRRMGLDDCLVFLSVVSFQLKPTIHSFLI